MTITFKQDDSKTSSQIYLDEKYLGEVVLEFSTQKWILKPSFTLPPAFYDAKKEKHHSSYKAGKKLVEVYKSLFPLDLFEQVQESDFSLDDMLMYLKARV